ncbi:signal peptidase I [Enterococcus moraviensis ATCC BAA-383]|uniref:Signal peptidase I n=1 Tax=Enterococcus moraviensis ATCC BAA-383 TaxID=1158609 RepID=R2TFH1_9ENTE|nr:signal peptidase I [Enterococcus moraviensis]EOH98904.1 signal peptidase I [Enterococcus moraviensis ATCC BAA-383]EOT71921.1 signal peptidase I [Enterococcus moraviensis ATCC BAA-383]
MTRGLHFSKRKKTRRTTLSPTKRREQRPVLPKKKSEKKAIERRRNWLKEGLLLFTFILVILFLAVFKTHRVSGKSMAPTFENNDRIIVQKNVSPKRYDIVTFDPEIPNDPSYVKRIVGLPGDQIWTESNAVYIRPSTAAPWQQEEVPQFIISMLPDSTLKVIVHEEVALHLAGMTTIPKGSYFVLGDNRAESKDSRALGLIEENQMEGVVVFRYFPFNKIGVVH